MNKLDVSTSTILVDEIFAEMPIPVYLTRTQFEKLETLLDGKAETIKVKFFDKSVYPDGLQKIGGKKSDWIDLRARETVVIADGHTALIPLGVAIQLPEGYEAIIAPRSSTFKNFGVLQTNSIGIIDETYCGDNDEWKLPVLATDDTVIEKGERICQFRIIEHQSELEFEYVDSLNNADRGGFGSSGTK